MKAVFFAKKSNMQLFNESLIYAFGYWGGSGSFLAGLFSGGVWFAIGKLFNAISDMMEKK